MCVDIASAERNRNLRQQAFAVLKGIILLVIAERDRRKRQFVGGEGVVGRDRRREESSADNAVRGCTLRQKQKRQGEARAMTAQREQGHEANFRMNDVMPVRGARASEDTLRRIREGREPRSGGGSPWRRLLCRKCLRRS